MDYDKDVPESGWDYGDDKHCFETTKAKLYNLSASNTIYGSYIFKVPEKYRNKNPEAYTPRLVSLGFIHIDKPHLKAMEEYKVKYLNHFLNTFKVSLAQLVTWVGDQTRQGVALCYHDLKRVKDNLVTEDRVSGVLLLDGIFVLELFLRSYHPVMREEGDIIFENPSVSNDILHDLLLLENQIPYKFLSEMYHELVVKHVGYINGDLIIYPSFSELVFEYFKGVGILDNLPLTPDIDNARHFVEFLSILSSVPEFSNAATLSMQQHYFERRPDFSKIPTTAELVIAGVKFVPGTRKGPLDVSFDMRRGVLIIPVLTVRDSTKTLLCNLMAFEHSGSYHKYMSSYIILLGGLVKTHKDVEILIRHGIIKNEFGSTEKVAEFLRNLHRELVVKKEEFRYVRLCYRLDGYSRSPWHKWMGQVLTLTPTVRTIGAIGIVGITLSIIHTVCSILQITSA